MVVIALYKITNKMMQTILIPTDFSIESTQVLKEYLQNLGEQEQVKIIFCAGYYRSESMYDLMFYSKTKVHKNFNLRSFEEAIHILENKYKPNVISTKIEFFSGWNQSSFQHFLEGNKIDQIIYSNDFKLKSKHKQWFDVVPLIQKVKYKQTEIHVPQEVWPFEQVVLSPLFTQK